MTNKQLVEVTGTILVHKDIETAFAFFSNPANDRVWRTEINESTLEGPLQQGVTVTEYSNLSKKAANNLVEFRCVQFQQNKMAVFETPGGAKFYVKSQRGVEAVSADQTRLVYTLSFDTAIVRFALGFGLPKFIVSMKAGADMKKYLRQLKNHLERI